MRSRPSKHCPNLFALRSERVRLTPPELRGRKSVVAFVAPEAFFGLRGRSRGVNRPRAVGTAASSEIRQGTQYASVEYVDRLEECGAELSMSRPGRRGIMGDAKTSFSTETGTARCADLRQPWKNLEPIRSLDGSKRAAPPHKQTAALETT